MMDRKTIIEIFKASPTPTSIVQADDTDFTFILVNDAYLQMTQREEDELLGKSLFKAFPANPEEEKPTGVDKLRSSFQKVIDSKKTDEISSIRYDIILDDGEYKQVYWKVINTPVLNEKGAVEIIINSATNITSQVLSKRENKLMLNNTEDSFILINRQLIIQNFNNLFAENYKEIFGLEVNKGDSILEYTQPERREKAKDIYKQVFKGKTIENEISAKSEDGHSRFFNIKFKPAKDENGEIIGSFISLIEKTDEHIAKLELEQNEARYRALVENGNDILFILTPEGKPKYASLSINNVLGYTPDEALELSIISSVHPDDIEMMAEEIQKCLDKPGVPIEVPPARLKDKEGNWHWFEGTITNMLHDPAIEGIVDNFREITDRLKAEKQIVEAKEQYQSLVQTINGVIWESDPKTLRVKYISPQSKGILGYEPEEWINTPGFWEKHLHPDDRQQTVKIFNEQTKSGNHHELEYRFKKSSGEYAWIRDVISFVKQKDKPAIVRGLMMDMSHEHELKQKLEQTYKIAQIGTWDLDLEDESLYWSNFVKDLHEVPKNFEPDLDSALEFYKKGWSRKAIIEAVENTIEHGTSFDLELNIITAKGNEKWVRAIGHPVMHNGVCKRIYGSTQNITTRKKAELQLKESNFSLIERVKEQRCLYEISNLKEQELSIDELLSKTVDLIPSGFQFNEITEAKIIWKDQSFKTDDFGESKITLTQSDDRFGEKNLLIEVHYVDTEHSYEELSFLEEENKLLKAITNQLSQKIDQIIKRDEIKAAEEKFRNVVEHSTNMFYQHDTQGVLTYISPQSSEFLGFSGDEAMTDWTEYITGHPINELGKQLTERAIKTGEVQPPYELQMRKKDGDIIWVEVNEAPLKQNGKVIGIVGSLTDITDRKVYEEQLHESLERYDYVTKATRDAIYDWDIKTDNLHWGEGFKNLFGYEINVELYPIDKWAELVHPADIKETREDLNSILQDSSKDTWSIEYRFLRKDGSYAHVLENGFIIRDENGKATRMIGALRDISD
ncbi:MAG: PAS domain-containing protein, partial [Balneolaceae bacterium]